MAGRNTYPSLIVSKFGGHGKGITFKWQMALGLARLKDSLEFRQDLTGGMCRIGKEGRHPDWAIDEAGAGMDYSWAMWILGMGWHPRKEIL